MEPNNSFPPVSMRGNVSAINRTDAPHLSVDGPRGIGYQPYGRSRNGYLHKNNALYGITSKHQR